MEKLNKEDMETIERLKSNPSLSEGLKNKMISDIINHRCPKCNSAMEELEEDFEGMTDGQMADWDAGFNRTFYCPKCKSTSLQDVEVFAGEDEGIMPTPAQLEALERGRRKGWSNKSIKGWIGEMWYATELRNKGYEIKPMMYYDKSQGIAVFNEEGVDELLKDYPKRDKLLEEINHLGRGYPDLICLKDGEVSFVEIKTNNSKLKEHQKEVIDLLKSMGYAVSVKRLNVDFSVEETNED